jgi:hypothetical protein
MREAIKKFWPLRFDRRTLFALSLVLIGSATGLGGGGIYILNEMNRYQTDSLDVLRVSGQAIDSARLAQIYFGLQMQDMVDYTLAPPDIPRLEADVRTLVEHTQMTQAMISQTRALILNEARLVGRVAGDSLAVEVAAVGGTVNGLLQEHIELERSLLDMVEQGKSTNGIIPYPEYEILRDRLDVFNAKMNQSIDNVLTISISLRKEIEERNILIYKSSLLKYGIFSIINIGVISIFLFFNGTIRSRLERASMKCQTQS